jgi:hypothetical protein
MEVSGERIASGPTENFMLIGSESFWGFGQSATKNRKFT